MEGIREKIASRVRLVGEARQAKRIAGTGLLRQAWEVVRCRTGRTRLTLKEYYNYRLWDDALYPDGKVDFGGIWLTRHLFRKLNNKAWEALMTDKLSTASVLETAGLPYPAILATVSAGRRFGAAPNLRAIDELASFLRGPCPYPVFLKPIKGSSGRGCHAVDGYDVVDDRLRLRDGREVDLVPFLAGLIDPTGFGFTVLQCLEPHPVIREVCGSDAVASCRIAVLVGDDGPRLFRVALKLPTGTAVTDNFNSGRSGNLLANVDRDTGEITRAIRGGGLGLTLVERHPDTDRPVVGRRVPDWEETVALVERAALAFPGTRWQNWDVAVTANGPVLLELNSAGDMNLLCLASGTGCYDAELRGFVARYRFPDDAPQPLFAGNAAAPGVRV